VPADAATVHAPRTVDAARRALTETFRTAGLDSPQLDARLLIAHALGCDQAALLADGHRLLDITEETTVTTLAQRRLAHEPVARIVGTKEFWSLDLHLDATTLVPRPETETVVEAALAMVDRHGSGAILLALLSELENAVGVGCDINSRAALTARDNARQLSPQRANRALFVVCDLTAALRGPFDLIVSNPPYIASSDIASLAPEVRLFDPQLALDGGADGLQFYRAIAAAAPALLAPDGAVVVEIGINQAEPVAALFAAAGLVPSPPRPDLNNVPRVVVASKAAANRR
jgi:release factor glutamine methyltransferase